MLMAVASVVVMLFISGGSVLMLMVTISASMVPGYRPLVMLVPAAAGVLSAGVLSAVEPDEAAGADEDAPPQATMDMAKTNASTSASAFFILLFPP